MINAEISGGTTTWVYDDCTAPTLAKSWRDWQGPSRNTPVVNHRPNSGPATAGIAYGVVRVLYLHSVESLSAEGKVLMRETVGAPMRGPMDHHVVAIGSLFSTTEEATPLELAIEGPGRWPELLNYEPGSVPSVMVVSGTVHGTHVQNFGWSTKNLAGFSSIHAPFLTYSDYELGVITGPTAADPLPIASDEESSPALDAARELKDWLNVTYEDLGSLTGVGPTTFFYWQREGGRPRPNTTRDLFRLHAFVRSLRNKLGESEARSWFQSGSPSPLALVRQGEFERVEQLASDLVFRDAVSAADRGAQFIDDSDAPYVAKMRASRPLQQLRRVKRTPLLRRDR